MFCPLGRLCRSAGVELDLPEGQHECMAAASYGLGFGAWRWSGFVLVLIWQVCWLTWISPCWAAIEARCQRAAWSVCFGAALEVGRTCVETFFEGLHSYASFGFSCCTSPGGRAGINERGGWTWTCATKPRVGRSHGGGLCRQGGFRWRLWFLVWGGLCRIGEAAHPGPNTSDATWTFGIANPSGLNSKVDQVAHQDGHVWVYSETHLSKHGFVKLRKGLQALQSPWKYLVPGQPCPVRSRGQVGVHSGVLLASRFPARPLPNSFDPDLFATGRIQVAGFMVGSVWVQVGMLYGFPCNATHTQARYQTDTCLAELVDRIVGQTVGPRIICGDFNYAVGELSQVKRLVDHGFREVQDLRAWQCGQSVQPTGRGTKRIDQVWISPELQTCLHRVDVKWDKWADHATVEVSFVSQGLSSMVQSWHVPSPFPWPVDWTCKVSFDTASDPTVAYAAFWASLEQQAKCWNAQHGLHVTKAQCGRGQTLQAQAKRQVHSPPKVARQGELVPGFFGVSLQHARFFKQLCRLQALRQLLKAGVTTLNAQVNAHETWRAIRHAAGFPGGFGLWWQQHGLVPALPVGLPYLVPGFDFIQQLFEGFHVFVTKYEADLAQKRYKFGKAKHEVDLNVVSRDCKEGPPPAVDTLLDRVEVAVEEVRSDDLSLVLSKSVTLLPDVPVVVDGCVLEVIAHEADQVWVSKVDGLTAGTMLTQERVVMSDQAILARFPSVWEPRWNKLSHVVPGQWDQICGFVGILSLGLLTVLVRQSNGRKCALQKGLMEFRSLTWQPCPTPQGKGLSPCSNKLNLVTHGRLKSHVVLLPAWQSMMPPRQWMSFGRSQCIACCIEHGHQ